ARRMENCDDIVIVTALEVLVSRDKAVERKALQVLGKKSRGLDLRIDRLRKILSKSEAEDEGTQVVDRRDTTNVMGECSFRIQFYVFTTLLGGLRHGLP